MDEKLQSDNSLVLKLSDLFENIGLNHDMGILAVFIVMLLVAWLADFISKKFLLQVLIRVSKKTATTWDDILIENKVFNKLAHIVPALIILSTANILLVDPKYEIILNIIVAAIKIFMVLTVLLSVDAFINALYKIYMTLEISKTRHIKGYIQIVKIIFYALAIILIISIIRNKPPNNILTGIGAMAAVLMLVFKDTILGFVASIQLSGNDMVRIGDWISMPSHGADGDVMDITLNTVKIQNFDKTISTVPTYALVSESFSNWRGMQESGGRRIKRHILIDMKSVKFCTTEMINKYKKIQRLTDYIDGKEKELNDYNEKNGIDNSVVVNGRRMTNIGVFREYLEAYLKNHPNIHKDMTLLIRQLQSSEKGIPMEIYVFTNTTDWGVYEGIQSDIFDHIMAVLPEFELSVYQNPSGEDFSKFLKQ